jgi:hypothetical protein
MAKRNSVTVCSELKEETENDPNFISAVITGDEGAIISMGDAKFTEAQESSTSSKQSQINADFLCQ